MKKNFFTLCLIITLGSFCYAARSNVRVILNRSVKISYDGKMQEFKNVSGKPVYPITFDGTTYLPIRSISSLFKQRIKWDANSNIIYLGEGDLDIISAQDVQYFISGQNEDIDAIKNEDVKIYYNGTFQTFRDINGKIVYPLNYEGTNYLPVRAISNLFGTSIEWDGSSNSVIISKIDNNTSNSSNILLNKTNLDLKVGESDNLVVTSGNNINLIWTSSNSNIVSISNGKVTAIKEGSAIVTAKTLDNSKSATCNVRVSSNGSSIIPKDTVKITSISLKKIITTIGIDETENLEVTLEPENADTKYLTWVSDNPNVVSVTNGIVKGIKTGTANITVTTTNGLKSVCQVKVEDTPVTSITLNKTQINLDKNGSDVLSVSIQPSNATNKEVTYISSNSAIASVDSNGKVTGISSGTAIITAKTKNGTTATCNVTVDSNKLIFNPNVTQIIKSGSNTYISVRASASSVAKAIGKQKAEQCLQYADKYAKRILSQVKDYGVSYTSYKKVGSENRQEMLYIVAKEIEAGRPVILRIRGGRHPAPNRWTRHFVTAYAIKENANLKNLKETDFLIIDPASASIKTFGVGIQLHLLTTKQDDWHQSDAKKYPGYQIRIYTNPDKYVSGGIYLEK